MPQFNENVELLNANGITVKLTNDSAEVIAGGNDTKGSIRLYQSGDNNTVSSEATIVLESVDALISTGGRTKNGSVIVNNSDGKQRITLEGAGADVKVGGNGAAGDIYLFNGGDPKPELAIIHMQASNGNLYMGGNGLDGDIFLFTANGDNKTEKFATIKLDAQAANAILGGKDKDGKEDGVDGDLILFRKDRDNTDFGQANIHLEGDDANLLMGGNGGDGDIYLFRGTGGHADLNLATIHFDGEEANLFLGGNGKDGDIFIRAQNDKGTNVDRIHLDGFDANLWLGGNGADGDIMIFKKDGDNQTLDNASIHLNGDTGNIRCNDVIIPGADFAEDFDIHHAIVNTLEPGTVMVLGKDGTLVESTKAFDRKVAGVVSGAGKYRPGIVLDKQPKSINRMPIALSGKVMVKIDASFGSIEVGDLITTSPRKGYAMKATDPLQSFGAVIGKALADFPDGDGMLPILVVLQ